MSTTESTTRILLDRSIFNGKDFAELKAIPFKALDSAGVLHVHVTPMLVAETLGLWLRDGSTVEVREHLQFISRITKKRWFNDNFAIFKDELCAKTLRSDYHLLPKETQAIWQQEISAIVAGGTARDKLTQRVREKVQKEQTRARNLREIGKRVRADIATKFRMARPDAKLSQVDVREAWNIVSQNNLDEFGKGLIVRRPLYRAGRREMAITRWLQQKERCPYFTDWVKGLLYMQFYAGRHQSSPLDENAQADIQHLIYLRHADVMVSEEKGFMRQAFVDLYESQGKQYWNVADLENFVTERSQLCEKEVIGSPN